MTDTNVTATDWRTEQRKRGKDLQHLLIDTDVTQADVAVELGLHGPTLSEYLRARRRWPDDFEQRFRKAVKARARA